MHKALGLASSTPRTHQELEHTPVIPALGKQRQGDQEIKVILSNTASLKPVWITGDAVSKRETTDLKAYCPELFS